MLDAAIKAQLKGYLERIQEPVELVASLDQGDKAGEMRAMLDEFTKKIESSFSGGNGAKNAQESLHEIIASMRPKMIRCTGPLHKGSLVPEEEFAPSQRDGRHWCRACCKEGRKMRAENPHKGVNITVQFKKNPDRFELWRGSEYLWQYHTRAEASRASMKLSEMLKQAKEGM